MERKCHISGLLYTFFQPLKPGRKASTKTSFVHFRRNEVAEAYATIRADIVSHQLSLYTCEASEGILPLLQEVHGAFQWETVFFDLPGRRREHAKELSDLILNNLLTGTPPSAGTFVGKRHTMLL